MHKKLTISLNEEVYEGLCRIVGRSRISPFIEALARPHVVPQDRLDAYREMAGEEVREAEARAWAEGTVLEVVDQEVGSTG